MKTSIKFAVGLLVVLMAFGAHVIAVEEPSKELAEETAKAEAVAPDTKELIEEWAQLNLQKESARAANQAMAQVIKSIEAAGELLSAKEVTAKVRNDARLKLSVAARSLRRYRGHCPALGLYSTLRRAQQTLKQNEIEDVTSLLQAAKAAAPRVGESKQLGAVVASIEDALAALKSDQTGKAVTAIAAAVKGAEAVAGRPLNAVNDIRKRIRKAHDDLAAATPTMPSMAELKAQVSTSMLDAYLQAADSSLANALKAIKAKDVGKLKGNLHSANIDFLLARGLVGKKNLAKLNECCDTIRELCKSTTAANLPDATNKVNEMKNCLSALGQ